jgi:hypothetical protein
VAAVGRTGLREILIGREIVHKSQGKPAEAFGIQPITARAIKGIVALDKIDPMSGSLTLMRRQGMDLLLPDCTDINIPLGLEAAVTA